jgi:hypothetical protein
MTGTNTLCSWLIDGQKRAECLVDLFEQRCGLIPSDAAD